MKWSLTPNRHAAQRNQHRRQTSCYGSSWVNLWTSFMLLLSLCVSHVYRHHPQLSLGFHESVKCLTIYLVSEKFTLLYICCLIMVLVDSIHRAAYFNWRSIEWKHSFSETAFCLCKHRLAGVCIIDWWNCSLSIAGWPSPAHYSRPLLRNQLPRWFPQGCRAD